MLVPAHARQAILDGSVDVLTGDLRLVVFKNTYDADAGVLADTFLADIAGGDRVGISNLLAGKTATGGHLRASNVVVPTPTAAVTPGGYWVFHDTGVEATSRLLACVTQNADTSPIEDGPQWPTDGTAITVYFQAAGLFSI